MGLILALPGNETFSRQLAESARWELGALETRRFPDGETYVRILSDVASRSVCLVCSLVQPDEGFLRLIFAADAARALGAREVTLIAPYLAYMRQDKRFRIGEAITSRTFARLISSSFDRLLTVDPHLHRYPALSALYSIPAHALHAAPLLADWIADKIEKPLIIGPDEESEQWVSAIAAQVEAPYAVLRKIRRGDRSVDIALPDLSRWRNCAPILVDDIASSGNTLIEAARKLRLQGFNRLACAVVHGVFAEDSHERLKRFVDQIVSSDSIPHESNTIRLAPLIAGAIISADKDRPDIIRQRRPPESDDAVEKTGADRFPANDGAPWKTSV
jgi:ribose-phosphate pyrophosphokinase